MRQAGQAYRIMETGRSPPFQTLSLGRMDIIRIIEITDTERLKEELRKEGWTPDAEEAGRWRRDGAVFRLTGSGSHAYVGPDGSCPPLDGIDALEPVDHGIFDISGKRNVESHALGLLARAAYRTLMDMGPIPAKVRASDLTDMEDRIERAWPIVDEMEGLSSVPSASKWNGLMRRLENRLEVMERRQRSENREILRVFQMLAMAAVSVDIAQYCLALMQVDMVQRIMPTLVALAVFAIGAAAIGKWHPKD